MGKGLKGNRKKRYSKPYRAYGKGKDKGPKEATAWFLCDDCGEKKPANWYPEEQRSFEAPTHLCLSCRKQPQEMKVIKLDNPAAERQKKRHRPEKAS